MAEFCALNYEVPFDPALFPVVENASKRDKSTLTHDLRLLAESRPDLGNPRTDNEFLERFIKARKYIFSDICDLYVNYYTFRQRNADVFNRLNGQDVLIQQALRDGFPLVLDQRDRRGRCILLFIAARWNCNCYSLLDIFRSLLLTLEFLIAEDINQTKGFVLVIDWTEFTYKQSSNLSPKKISEEKEKARKVLHFHENAELGPEMKDIIKDGLFWGRVIKIKMITGKEGNDFVICETLVALLVLKLMIEGLQDCFPAKFKGIHFIGQPWYVEMALTFIKPFLKEKGRERIHLHGNNLSTLHQFIARDILPSELGGEGPPFNPLPWAENIMSKSLE